MFKLNFLQKLPNFTFLTIQAESEKCQDSEAPSKLMEFVLTVCKIFHLNNFNKMLTSFITLRNNRRSPKAGSVLTSLLLTANVAITAVFSRITEQQPMSIRLGCVWRHFRRGGTKLSFFSYNLRGNLKPKRTPLDLNSQWKTLVSTLDR